MSNETPAQEWCRLNRSRSEVAEVRPRMAEIMQEIGLKECLREWNHDLMRPDEFDLWWDRRPRLK